MDFSERGWEVLPRDIDFLRDGRKFFLCHPLGVSCVLGGALAQRCAALAHRI